MFIHDFPTNTTYFEYSCFPKHAVAIILSHHFSNHVNNSIVHPQTTLFDCFSFREFFDTPEITLSSISICTTGTSILDVDDRATNITWILSHTALFTGATLGTGTNATINASSSNGEATITYSFEMPSGETFSADKNFWVGVPNAIDVYDDPTYFYCGQMNIVNVDYGDYTYYDMGINQVNWSYQGGTLANINDGFTKAYITAGNNAGNGYIYVDAYNRCGSTGDRVYYEIECFMMRLVITQNPTTDETELSIESDNEKILFDESAEWDLEVFSQTQELKVKETKLKGKKHKIKTAGWKEGVYIVHVKYKDQILQEKLIVKR